MLKPKVSLYIPCYDAKKYILHCLEAVFKQTYPIDEVLIIDDTPTDEIKKMVASYSVKHIWRKKKLGLPSARNLAFNLAKNEFVAGLDVDCLAAKDWLERLMENFTEDNIVGVGGKTVEKYTSTLIDKWRSIYMKQHWADEKIINPYCLFGSNHLFKKSAVLAVGLFDEEKCKKGYEDVDISCRLKKAGYKLIYEPKAVVYHLRQDNLSSLLKTHWNWTFVGIGGRRTPDNLFNLICKIYDNIFYLFRNIKKDIKEKRLSFLFINIIMFFHHLVLDIKYFINSKCKRLHLFP